MRLELCTLALYHPVSAACIWPALRESRALTREHVTTANIDYKYSVPVSSPTFVRRRPFPNPGACGNGFDGGWQSLWCLFPRACAADPTLSLGLLTIAVVICT